MREKLWKYIAHDTILADKNKKARFILYALTDQKTERASRIFKLLDDLQDDKEKAVLMALVLGMIEKRSGAGAWGEKKVGWIIPNYPLFNKINTHI